MRFTLGEICAFIVGFFLPASTVGESFMFSISSLIYLALTSLMCGFGVVSLYHYLKLEGGKEKMTLKKYTITNEDGVICSGVCKEGFEEACAILKHHKLIKQGTLIRVEEAEIKEKSQ